MAKRLFDILFSISALIILFPIMLLTGIVIKISSPGSILYVARRAGINSKPINVYKFRTMHVGTASDSAITKTDDLRIFKFGSLLRKSKLDELPQFYNVLIGDMSIVGPRPEDIEIVKNFYNKEYVKTLCVKPGIASPGSIFNYTHNHKYLSNESNIEKEYIENFLPIKLAIERIYIERASFWYDVKLIFRTLVVIIAKLFGKDNFTFPEEYHLALNKGYFII